MVLLKIFFTNLFDERSLVTVPENKVRKAIFKSLAISPHLLSMDPDPDIVFVEMFCCCFHFKSAAWTVNLENKIGTLSSSKK